MMGIQYLCMLALEVMLKRLTEVVKILLDNRAQVDLQSTSGKSSALMHASEIGHAEVVKLLLDNQAQIDLVDSDGNSAFLHASFRGHADVVKLLLENKAQIDLVEKIIHSHVWLTYMLSKHSD